MLSTSKRVGSIALGATLLVAACGSSGGTTAPSAAAPSTAASAGAPLPSLAAPASCVQGSTTAAGSTALQPVVDAAGKAYQARGSDGDDIRSRARLEEALAIFERLGAGPDATLVRTMLEQPR